MSRIRTGEAMFDKIAGENERNEVRTVAIWKGARERSEVGLYNLVARPIRLCRRQSRDLADLTRRKTECRGFLVAVFL